MGTRDTSVASLAYDWFLCWLACCRCHCFLCLQVQGGVLQVSAGAISRVAGWAVGLFDCVRVVALQSALVPPCSLLPFRGTVRPHT